MLLAAAAAHPPLVCHGPPPKPDCQCMCAPTATHAGGLIYMCQRKQWFCPPPAKTPPAPQPKP
jgi:hypothetical protein